MAPTPRKDEQDKTKPPTPAKRPAKGEPAAKSRPKEDEQKKGGTRVNYTGPDEDGPELGGGTDQFLTR